MEAIRKYLRYQYLRIKLLRPKTIVISALVIGAIAYFSFFNTPNRQDISFSQFSALAAQNKIKSVAIDFNVITGVLRNHKKFYTPNYLQYYKGVMKNLTKNQVVMNNRSRSNRLNILSYVFNIVTLGLFVLIFKQMYLDNRTKYHAHNDKNIKLSDVKGIDHIRDDLAGVIELLLKSCEDNKLKPDNPRGILLVGPPGTGKTMLAKAIANEAGFAFLAMSGADFNGMFYGMGAMKMRKLFRDARIKQPCIIFIDEIDSIGKRNTFSNDAISKNDNNTINQMLAMMQGFEVNDKIIVLGATNHKDNLDSALLRPGRFDRIIDVPYPDLVGRTEVYKGYLNGIPIDDTVNCRQLAKASPGSSGAEIKNIINEAKLQAIKEDRDVLTRLDFEKARERIIFGQPHHAKVIDPESQKIAAYHEAGHAIVGLLQPDRDKFEKVTIVPHGKSLGATWFSPDEEQHFISKQKAEGLIQKLLGGRAAEEIKFGTDKITNGAADDLQRATELASMMVNQWAFFEANWLFVKKQENITFFRSSDHGEIKKINQLLITEYNKAKDLIKANEPILEAIATKLIEHETLYMSDVAEIIQNEKGNEIPPSQQMAAS